MPIYIMCTQSHALLLNASMAYEFESTLLRLSFLTFLRFISIMAPSFSQTFSIVLALAQIGLAEPTAAAQSACADIKTAIPGKLFVKSDAEYTKENTNWWNSGISDMAPACIAMPSSPEDVSKIVTLLNKHVSVPFAIKSGGHDPNRGQSSVKEGILIALRNIAGVELDKAKGVAYVKPGGHWRDVVKPLDDQGYTVESSNILEYEIVLANGTIARIKQSERPELVQAMRGGGDQFGIITRFTLQAYPIGKAWGGARIYAGNRDQIYDALHDFIGNNYKDPKASVIFTGESMTPYINISAELTSFIHSFGGLLATPGSGIFSESTEGKRKRAVASSSAGSAIMSAVRTILNSGETGMAASKALEASPRSRQLAVDNVKKVQVAAGNSSSIFMVMINYDGPDPPKGAFRKFEALNASADHTTTMPYSSVISMSDANFDSLSMHTSFRSISLPYEPNNPGYYAEIEDTWNSISQSYISRAKGTVTATIAFQPFPRTIGQASEKRGGNAMGLTAKDKDRFILEIAGVYNNSEDDDLVQAMGREFTDALTQKLKVQMQSNFAGDCETYNPLFMNDAGPDQDVMGSYKDSNKFIELQRSVDPDGLWAKRAGGYKLAQ
ncbi:hypothetical protein FKW77_007603 [Venturia effusa]|uniref:FAD linked oxidase N-terminal domain-containing protein n=1 Tax=Venturia effusa TaxID=50376 RepID=A0A517LB90_9PEZI|nr:hypothetical protein FKW77_007603 [Venturia effusa]